MGRNIKSLLIRLFRLKSSAHSISLGLVLGFFPCWFPTFGVGPFFSVLIARSLGGNTVAAIIAAAFGSFLWPLLFYLNYWTGALFFGGNTPEDPQFNYEESVDLHFYEHIVQKFRELGIPFTCGAVLNSILFTVFGYFLFKWIFSKFRLTFLDILRKKVRP